jgi:hypothetical protein
MQLARCEIDATLWNDWTPTIVDDLRLLAAFPWFAALFTAVLFVARRRGVSSEQTTTTEAQLLQQLLSDSADISVQPIIDVTDLFNESQSNQLTLARLTEVFAMRIVEAEQRRSVLMSKLSSLDNNADLSTLAPTPSEPIDTLNKPPVSRVPDHDNDENKLTQSKSITFNARSLLLCHSLYAFIS